MGVFRHPKNPKDASHLKNYRSLKCPTHSLSLDSNKNSFCNKKKAEWDPGHFPQSEQQTNKSRLPWPTEKLKYIPAIVSWFSRN